jgi:TATA-box binding protein (TBP) (component of TFIID and TFIIIB)
VTGVKTFEDLNLARKAFAACLKLKENVLSEIIIDNLTHSGDFSERVNVDLTINKLRNESNIERVRYNSEIFPGAFVRVKSGGTLILFSTGRYTIIGTKCHQQAQNIRNQVCANIVPLSKTMLEAMKYVQIAD